MQHRELESWISKRVFGKIKTERFVLIHVGSKGEPTVEEWEIPPEPSDSFASELVNSIESAAFSDASGFEGVQTYAVQAFEGNRKTPHSRIAFRMQGGSDEMTGPSEPSNATGLVGQAMRHTEAFMRLSVTGANQTIQALMAENARMSARLNELESGRMKLIETMESLASQKMERELILAEAKRKEEFTEQIFDKANLLLPVLINRVAGKPLLPVKQTPEKIMIDSLVDSFTKEQLEQLQGILTPDQLIPIWELVQKRIEAHEQKQKALPESTGR